MGKRLAPWGPAALWAGFLFLASSRSDAGALGRVPDWLTHGLAYLVLGVLLLHALSGDASRPSSVRTAFLAVLLATLYGVSDEWHQSFVPGRDSSAADVGKDAAGAVLGVGLARRLASRPRRESSAEVARSGPGRRSA